MPTTPVASPILGARLNDHHGCETPESPSLQRRQCADPFYFAFGPSMSPTLLKKRGFLAIESFAGRLAGYQLAFTLMGYEGCEPRFANLMRHDPTNPSGMQVHGIAHRLTRDDLERLDEFEGSGFKRIEALFEPQARTSKSAHHCALGHYFGTPIEIVVLAPQVRLERR